MNFTMNSPSDLLFKVVTLIGYLVMVYWMYVGWRAMRAHERLAAAAETAAAQARAPLPRVSDGPLRHE
jgi:uncharacterized membrane protein